MNCKSPTVNSKHEMLQKKMYSKSRFPSSCQSSITDPSYVPICKLIHEQGRLCRYLVDMEYIHRPHRVSFEPFTSTLDEPCDESRLTASPSWSIDAGKLAFGGGQVRLRCDSPRYRLSFEEKTGKVFVHIG